MECDPEFIVSTYGKGAIPLIHLGVTRDATASVGSFLDSSRSNYPDMDIVWAGVNEAGLQIRNQFGSNAPQYADAEGYRILVAVPKKDLLLQDIKARHGDRFLITESDRNRVGFVSFPQDNSRVADLDKLGSRMLLAAGGLQITADGNKPSTSAASFASSLKLPEDLGTVAFSYIPGAEIGLMQHFISRSTGNARSNHVDNAFVLVATPLGRQG